MTVPPDPIPSSLLRQEGPQQEDWKAHAERLKSAVSRAHSHTYQFGYDCGVSDMLAVVLNVQRSAPSTDLAAAQARIVVLEGSIDYLRNLIDHPVKSPWQPITTAPRHERCFFWVVPKTADECPTNTSGEPITMEGRGEPHRVDGEWGWWGALWKPTHWMPHPVPPAEGEK